MLKRRVWCRSQQSRHNDVHLELAIRTFIAQVASKEEEQQPLRGSVSSRIIVPRDRYSGYWRLMQDYFFEPHVFGDNFFRQRYVLPAPHHCTFINIYHVVLYLREAHVYIARFRMCKAMFIDICHAVVESNVYFHRRLNVIGLPGFATVQKVTAAVRMLAYRGPADRLDEYIRMGKSTILEIVNQFTRTIIAIYGATYLRQPNSEDIFSLLHVPEHRGFPGMLGSLDCMHWEWERCPTALHGQYRGHFKKPTIILEVVASVDMWIWHAFFGMSGSCNDINVLHHSPLFDNLAQGIGPEVNYTVNGREYNMRYYLTNGIYPPWATLISGISRPQSTKQKYFTMKQSEY
jgi:hypothetical protein